VNGKRPGAGGVVRVANLRRRVWLLLLLDGVERVGLVPLSKLRLHRLAYLANALSPVYDLPVPDGQLVKYKRGPYYPDLQWDVDRIAVQGLIRIYSIRHKRDEFGWWLDADYGLTKMGLAVVSQAVSLEDVSRVHSYLCEAASAFARFSDDHARDDAPLEDATFDNPNQGYDTLIDLSEIRRNLSVQTAASMSELSLGDNPILPRDQLHLYFRYMERVLRKASGQ